MEIFIARKIKIIGLVVQLSYIVVCILKLVLGAADKEIWRFKVHASLIHLLILMNVLGEKNFNTAY